MAKEKSECLERQFPVGSIHACKADPGNVNRVIRHEDGVPIFENVPADELSSEETEKVICC